MKRGDLGRPDDPFGVVVLLDGGGGGAPDPDPVATHDGEALLPLGVQKLGAHRLAVLGAEHEHMAHFDAARCPQPPAPARGRIARPGIPEVGKLRN